MRHLIRAWLLVLLAAAWPPAVLAQTYPNRPVRVVYPFPPGGGDSVVRLFCERLSQALGQPVVLDHRGGAGGNIGADAVAKSPADGYTLLMGTNGALAVNPTLYQKMSFDPQTDFVPISNFVAAPQVLFVNKDVPANSLKELIALAKAKPGSLTYASVGQGSASHLTMELFKSLTGTEITHVPYKGAGPAITDVLGGQVSMMVVIAGSALPHVKAGTVKALAITSARPSALVPGVPTMAEAGVTGMEATAWFALVAPAGTPRDVVARLHAETGRFLTDPAIRERINQLGFEPTPSTPEEAAAMMRRERELWGKVIKATGARVD